jgi:cell division protein FtsL
MARSSAAAVAAPPAKRRKPSTRHATTQTPRGPARRTSGPAKGRKSAHARQGAAARATRTAGAVAAPRRAPARKPAKRAPRAQATRTAPLVQRLAHGRAGAIADQMLRGRACVALVFALLVGIVFLNVSLLKMNGGIAATNAKATALEHENARLRSRIAPLGSSERIQREAVKRGYSLPAAGDVGYVTGTARENAKLAVERMTAPGMGTGTASRPAAQVQEQQAAGGTTPTTATTSAPAVTPPASTTTPPPAAPPPATEAVPTATAAP